MMDGAGPREFCLCFSLPSDLVEARTSKIRKHPKEALKQKYAKSQCRKKHSIQMKTLEAIFLLCVRSIYLIYSQEAALVAGLNPMYATQCAIKFLRQIQAGAFLSRIHIPQGITANILFPQCKRSWLFCRNFCTSTQMLKNTVVKAVCEKIATLQHRFILFSQC